MTSWVIGHDHRFKAAISERAVNHHVSAAGSSDVYWVFEREFGGPWYDNVGAWLRALAGHLRTCDRDTRADPPLRTGSPLQHRTGRAPLHAAATPRQGGEMLRFPAETHELSRAGRRSTACCGSRRSSSGSAATSLPAANRTARQRGRDGAPPRPRGASGAGRDEVVEEMLREVSDLVHGTVEDRLVGLRRLVHAADLAHVLQRRRVHLFGGRGRIEVVENADVPAHASMLSALTYSDIGIYSELCPGRPRRRTSSTQSPRSTGARSSTR